MSIVRLVPPPPPTSTEPDDFPSLPDDGLDTVEHTPLFDDNPASGPTIDLDTPTAPNSYDS